MRYQAVLPAATVPQTGSANTLSIRNAGGSPGTWTQTGGFLQSWTPLTWTIEAAFNVESSAHRTIVGRDSRGSCKTDGNLSALYLQTTPTNQIAIKFCGRRRQLARGAFRRHRRRPEQLVRGGRSQRRLHPVALSEGPHRRRRQLYLHRLG